MQWDGASRWIGRRFGVLAALVGITLVLAACGGGDSEEEPRSGGNGSDPGSATTPAAPAGPTPQERSSAISSAERALADLEEKAKSLRDRATIDGVLEDPSVRSAIREAEEQLDATERAVDSLKRAGDDAWENAKSSLSSAASSLSSTVDKATGKIRAVRDAQREGRIAAMRPMMDKGLIKGLDDEIYLVYKDSVVERVQETLADQGLYDGPIDGYLEETTQRALAAYQERSGIHQTGVPTPKTRRALFEGILPGMEEED